MSLVMYNESILLKQLFREREKIGPIFYPIKGPIKGLIELINFRRFFLCLTHDTRFSHDSVCFQFNLCNLVRQETVLCVVIWNLKKRSRCRAYKLIYHKCFSMVSLRHCSFAATTILNLKSYIFISQCQFLYYVFFYHSNNKYFFKIL